MSTGIDEPTKLIPAELWLGFLLLASAASCSVGHVQQTEAKPNVIKSTPFAISGETVEGVTLSPNGSEIAVVGSQLLPSEDANQGDRNLFLDIWSIEKAKRIARLQLSSVRYSLLAGVPQPEIRVGDRFIRYGSNGKMIV